MPPRELDAQQLTTRLISKVVRVMVAVAAGELSENDLTAWLRAHNEAIDHEAS